MIRADLILDLTGIDTLDAFLDAYPTFALEVVRDSFNQEIKPGLLAELRYQPGPAKLPFQFATPKSKRYYFFAVRKGLIKTSSGRYTRTGKLVQGWDTTVSISDNAVVMSVTNPAKAVRYVTGSRQVPGHRNTGWPLHRTTIDFWRDAAEERTLAALNRWVIQRLG